MTARPVARPVVRPIVGSLLGGSSNRISPIIETGTFASPVSTTGNQVVSLDSAIWEGAAPKVVLFWGISKSSDGSTWESLFGFGVGVSATSRASISSAAQNGQGTSVADRRHSNASVISNISVGGTLAEEADYVTDATGDQFTINWTTSHADQNLYSFLAIGGEDVEVYLDEMTSPTSTGEVSYTGVGFKPDCLIPFGMGGFSPPASGTNAVINIGLHDGVNSKALAVKSVDNLSTSVCKRHLDDSFIVSGSDFNDIASVTSLDSDGYTLDWTTADGSARYNWILCINGVRSKLITCDQPTTDTTVARSVGFTPQGGLCLTHMGAGTGFRNEAPSVTGYSQSFQFNGERDLIDCGQDSSVDNIWGSGGTFTAWAKIYSGKKAAIFDKGGSVFNFENAGASGIDIYIWRSMSVTHGAWRTDGDAVPYNEWVHVAVTYDDSSDSNEPIFYLNGVSIPFTELSTPSGTANSDVSSSLKVGNWGSYSRGFDGLYSDMRAYKRILSAAEILALATEGTEPSDTNLVVHLPFDGDLLDLTANNNDGTLDGKINNDSRIGIGATDFTNSAFAGAVDEDGQSTTDADRVQDSNEAIKHIDHARTVVGSCAATKTGPTVTETWTDTDGTAREHTWLFLG